MARWSRADRPAAAFRRRRTTGSDEAGSSGRFQNLGGRAEPGASALPGGLMAPTSKPSRRERSWRSRVRGQVPCRLYQAIADAERPSAVVRLPPAWDQQRLARFQERYGSLVVVHRLGTEPFPGALWDPSGACWHGSALEEALTTCDRTATSATAAAASISRASSTIWRPVSTPILVMAGPPAPATGYGSRIAAGHRTEHVVAGQDPEGPAGAVDHRQPVDAMVKHRPHRLHHRTVGFGGHRLGTHQVADPQTGQAGRATGRPGAGGIVQ